MWRTPAITASKSSTPTAITKTQWGGFGSGNGKFDYPCGVAVDGQGKVYVADTHNNLIQKFDSNGGFLAQWGGSGSGDGQFANPRSVAVNGQGNLYVQIPIITASSS